MDQAEPLYREVLAGRRRVLGEAHVHTLNTMQGLALCLVKQAEALDAKAAATYSEAAELYVPRFGEAHPQVKQWRRAGKRASGRLLEVADAMEVGARADAADQEGRAQGASACGCCCR